VSRGGARPGAGQPRKAKLKKTIRVYVDAALVARVDSDRRGESRTHWVEAAIDTALRGAPAGRPNVAAIRAVRHAVERVQEEPASGVPYFVGYLGDAIGLPVAEQLEIATLLVQAERDRHS
jgi:hypothetical protein